MGHLVKSPRLQSLQDSLQACTATGKSLDFDGHPDEMKNDGSLHDTGTSLARLQLSELPNPFPSTLLQERLQLLGLDPGFVAMAQIETSRKLQQTCSACSSWRRCARDLSCGDETTGMECYCLNAATLDELLVEKLEDREVAFKVQAGSCSTDRTVRVSARPRTDPALRN
jgi:hypothetical protein